MKFCKIFFRDLSLKSSVSLVIFNYSKYSRCSSTYTERERHRGEMRERERGRKGGREREKRGAERRVRERGEAM